jgi:Tfp pilus assembly protein PilF
VSLYEKNLQALAQHHPELVARLQQGIDTSHIAVEMAHSGTPRLLVTTPTGEQVAIHNEAAPLASASQSANSLQLEKEGIFILLGFGLGYLALEILKKLDKGHVLLICEIDVGIFHMALCLTDLAPLLHSEQVKILVGDDIPLTQWIDTFSAKYLLSKIALIKYHPAARLASESYRRLENQVADKTRTLDVNAATLFALGRVTMQNLFTNMPWVHRLPGVKRLANLFPGRPGIVVAAGPSLEKNFRLLKDVKGKAVIIAVDTVLRLLLPHGILPDIVVTLDPQELNYKKFRDLALEPSVPLVCHPISYPEIIKNYPGKKFITGTPYPIYHWFAPFWEEKGNIDVNTQSVGHMAFNLAMLLGVDPIVFIGLDLCFSQDKIHAGNLSEGMTSRDQCRADLAWTTDIFGAQVESIVAYKSFQRIFEEGIQEIQAHCIDATEGGVRLVGTQVMRLREVIDEYCQVEPLDIAGTISAVASDTAEPEVGPLLEELRCMQTKIRAMVKASRRILYYVQALQKMQQTGQTTSPRYMRLASLVEEATSYMKEQADILSLLPEHAYQLELYMSQQHIVDIDDMEEGEERFTRQLERAQVYYRALQGVLDPLAQGIRTLIRHLQTAQALAQRHAESGTSLQLALAYKELGHYERAAALFAPYLQQAPPPPEVLYHLAAMYVSQGRYQEALPLVDKGKRIYPSFHGMQKLYDECQQKVACWEERQRQACQPEANGDTQSLAEALLEAGNFYFRVQDLERAEAAYQKVLAAYPHLPEVHYHLAHTYFAQEDFATGLAELEAVLTLTPDNPVVYRDLGLVACKHGKYHEAERFFQQAIALAPDAAYPYELLGDLYVQRGAWVQAAQVYEALLRLHPDRVDVLPTLASLYHQQIAVSSNKH